MAKKIILQLLLLLIVAVFQVYLFDRIPVAPYLHISFYLLYVVFLPIDTHPAFVLLSSALLGALTDILTGSPAVTTITATAAAYARILLLKTMVPREKASSAIPSVFSLGISRFTLYSCVIVLLNVLLTVLCESGFFFLTNGTVLLRLLANSGLTLALVFCAQLLVVRKPKSRWS